jgi:hypothetical protein
LREKAVFRVGFQNFSGIGKAVHEVSRPFIGDFTARHKDNSLYIESIAGTFARIIVCISHLGIAGE